MEQKIQRVLVKRLALLFMVMNLKMEDPQMKEENIKRLNKKEYNSNLRINLVNF